MFDRERVVAILRQIDQTTDTIKVRTRGLQSPDDFTDTPAGREKLDSICMLFMAIGEALKVDRVRKHPDSGIEMFFPAYFITRSQDLPVALHDAGQFYWGRPKAWMALKRIFDRYSFPLTIPRWRVQDIDTEDDWRRAELIWEALRLRHAPEGLMDEN